MSNKMPGRSTSWHSGNFYKTCRVLYDDVEKEKIQTNNHDIMDLIWIAADLGFGVLANDRAERNQHRTRKILDL